ncbi:unnamed protein product [Paramecium pentaurelia]|uniref:Uncharacterized protein n=1 Tax=Paramecium pentaurelia TaxID=43138 RepID=A0A8S1T738_9CILI|nr:unnamed protein product [Paramecium pentaurelia]
MQQQQNQSQNASKIYKKASTNSNCQTDQKYLSPRTTESTNRKISHIYEEEFRQRVDSILHENHQQLNLGNQLLKQLEDIKQQQVDKNEEILRAIKFYKNFHTHSPQRQSSTEQRSISPKSKNPNVQQLQKGFQNPDVKDVFDKLSQYKFVELNYFLEELQESDKQTPSLAYKKIHNKDLNSLPEQIKYFSPSYLKSILDYSKSQANSIKQHIQQVIETSMDKIHIKKPSLKQSSKYADINWQKIDQNFKDQSTLINELQHEVSLLQNQITILQKDFGSIQSQQQTNIEQTDEKINKISNDILQLQENTNSITYQQDNTKKSSTISRQSISNLSETQIKRTTKQKQTDLVEKHAMLSYFRAEFVTNFDEINQKFQQMLEDNKKVLEERINNLSQEFKNLTEAINYTQILQNISSSVEPSNNQDMIQKSCTERAQEIIDNESITNIKSQQESQNQNQEKVQDQSITQEIDTLKTQNDVLIKQINSMHEDIQRLNRWIKEQQNFNQLYQTKFEKRLSQVQSDHEIMQQEQEQCKIIMTTFKNSMRIDAIQNSENSFRSDQEQILQKQYSEKNIHSNIQQLDLKVQELTIQVDKLDNKLQKFMENKTTKNISINDILIYLHQQQHVTNICIISEKKDFITLGINSNEIKITTYIKVYDNSFFTAFAYQFLKNKIMYEQDDFYSFIEDIKQLNFIVYCDQLNISQSQFGSLKQLLILYLIQIYNEDQDQRIQAFNQLYKNQNNLNFHILANIFIRNMFHSKVQSTLKILNWNTEIDDTLNLQSLSQQLNINLHFIQVCNTEFKKNIFEQGKDKIGILDHNKQYYIINLE